MERYSVPWCAGVVCGAVQGAAGPGAVQCGARCSAVQCGAVRGAVQCGAVRGGAVRGGVPQWLGLLHMVGASHWLWTGLDCCTAQAEPAVQRPTQLGSRAIAPWQLLLSHMPMVEDPGLPQS